MQELPLSPQIAQSNHEKRHLKCLFSNFFLDTFKPNCPIVELCSPICYTLGHNMWNIFSLTSLLAVYESHKASISIGLALLLMVLASIVIQVAKIKDNSYNQLAMRTNVTNEIFCLTNK